MDTASRQDEARFVLSASLIARMSSAMAFPMSCPVTTNRAFTSFNTPALNTTALDSAALNTQGLNSRGLNTWKIQIPGPVLTGLDPAAEQPAVIRPASNFSGSSSSIRSCSSSGALRSGYGAAQRVFTVPRIREPKPDLNRYHGNCINQHQPRCQRTH